MKFKTNINCGNCLRSVTPVLDELLDDNGAWSVDLQDPDRVLEVQADDLTPEQVQEALDEIGFEAELIFPA